MREALGYKDTRSKVTKLMQKLMDKLSKITIKKVNEDVPTNSMGASSSTSGPIATFDPKLGKKKVLRRFKSFVKKD